MTYIHKALFFKTVIVNVSFILDLMNLSQFVSGAFLAASLGKDARNLLLFVKPN